MPSAHAYAGRSERDESVTVRVIPLKAGAHPGLSGPFYLLDATAPCRTCLYLDAGREATLITGSDPRMGLYADDFEGSAGEFTVGRRVH